MRIHRVSLIVGCACALVAAGMACAGISDLSGPKAVATEQVITVEVSQSQVTIGVGGTVALQALARDGDGKLLPGRRTYWSSSDSTVARVSVAGLVTALRTGTAVIAATVDGKSAVSSLTVMPRAVASVSITPTNPQVNVGGVTQLVAHTFDDIGGEVTGRTVAWTSNDTHVALVDVSGRVTGVAVGNVTITATSEGHSASVGFTVAPVPVATVQVTPPLDTVVLGQTTQRSAVLRDSSGAVLTDRTVSWSSNNLSVATVSSSGLVIGAAAGTATITATSEGQSGTSQVVVRPRPVSAVIVSPSQAALSVGQSVTLTAQITDDGGNLLTGRPTQFQSDNSSVAQVNTDGRVIGVAPGVTTITVTSEGRSGTASITVTTSPIASVRIEPTSVTLLVGGTSKLTAVPLDAAGNVLGQRPVTWTTGAPSIATVATDGTVTGIGDGAAVIFATVEGRVASVPVLVNAVPVGSVFVSPTVNSIIVGDQLDLTAQVRDAAGNPLAGRTVVWSSSDDQLAVVSSTGRVRAIAAGVPRIFATADGVSGSATVTVAVEPVLAVIVSPTTLGMLPGQTAQITATPTGRNNVPLTGRGIAYSTSNAAIATVSSTGLVTAIAVGNVVITATCEGRQGTVPVSVSPTPVATVSVTLASSSIFVGVSTQATATTRAANGTVLPGRVVVWSSSNPAVATVNASGVVTALSVGTTSIIATSEGKTGNAPLTTTPAPVANVSVAVTASARFVGETTEATATLRDALNNVLTGRTIVWSSSNALVATVSSSGLVTAVGPGTANIIATSEGVPGFVAVTVTLAPVSTVTVTLAGSALLVGQTTQGTAVLRDLNNFVLTGRVVTWSSSNSLVASVSPSGLVTALLPGAAIITATSEGKNGTANVSVALVPVTSVTVTLGSSAINVGATTQGTAVTRDSVAGLLTGRTIVWSSSNPAAATVSATGLVTAVAPGSSNIIATAEGISGQQTVIVSLAPVNTVSVALAPSTVILGQTSQATVTLRDVLNLLLTGRTVVWSSSNPAVATVSQTGVVTTVGVGTADIIATSETKTGLATLTVSPVPVNSVTVSLASSVFVGFTAQGTATTRATDNSVLTGRTIAWSSSNPAVATVSPTTGLVTGVSVGTAIITATSEGKSGTANISVGLAPVNTVTVSLLASAIVIGGGTTASATTFDANNTVLTGRTVVWSSSNPAVASVNASSGAVTGVSVGSVNIIATSEGKTGSASVSVGLAPVNTVLVGLQATSIFVLATTQATATLRDANNNILTGRTVVWSSSNAAVATVNASTGVVTGVSVGTANIIATSEGKTDFEVVTVTLAPVNTVSVGLTASNIVVLGSTQATATLKDVNNNTLTGRTVVWSSDNVAVATVNATTGVVTGVSVGTANIIATSEGKTGSAAVAVGLAPVNTVTVGLQASSIFILSTTQATATLRDANNNVLTGRSVVWSTSNAAVATVNASTGVVTGVSVGTANIIATSEGKTGSAAVSVTIAPVNTVTVGLQSSGIVVLGSTQATATLKDVNNNVLTGRTVVWSSDNVLVATVNASTGVVTGVLPGTANIIATSEGKTGSAAVTVSLAPVNTVTVSLQASNIVVLGTTQATATLKDANNNTLTGRTVVWSSDNTAIATVNASTGVVTGVAVGTANIIATSEGKTGSAAVAVGLAPVNTVTVGLQASSIFVLATTQATATLRDANNNVLTGRTVVWSTSNAAVATVNASTGVVTGVSVGTANIIATSEGKTGSAAVSVTLAPVNTVTVALQASTIFVLATTQATATLTDVNNNTLSGRTVVWTSDNTAVATVNSSTGVVTGVSVGTANIIATSEGKTDFDVVTVTLAPVNTVSVGLQASNIVVLGTTQATATLRDVNNNVLTGRTVVWSSDNTAIATVNASTGVVTGVAVGTANIIATSEGKTGAAAVSVGLAPVNTVTVGLQASSIFVLATTQATATLRDANNNVLTGRTVVWSTSNAAIATVNASTGVVTGVAVGTANIIATSEGKTGSAAVTVTLAPVNAVTVGLQASSIFELATTQATATLRDVNNNVLSGRTVVWSSDNTSIATVNASTGVVTGVAVGTANIIATSEGKTGSAAVTVTLAPVNTVSVGLQSSSIVVLGTTQATATLRDVNNNVLTGRTVVWSSDNTAIATVNSSTGVVTGVAAGTANIIATSEGKTGSTAVTVTLAPVNTVTVGLQSSSIVIAGTTQATATLRDVNNNVLTGRTVVWTSDNTAIATVNSSTGVVTGVAVGTANIIATSESKTGSAAVTVGLAPVNTVTVGLQASSIFVLATTQATATLRDVNNNVLTGRTVVWSSDNTAIATVNASTGVVTGVAAGTANIIATSEGKTGSALVTVTLAPVNTVSVGLQAASIFELATTQATATLKDVNNNTLSGRTVVWSSDNTSIATVNASTGVVTGVAVGTANIIATSEGKTGSAAVTVTLAPVNTVTVGLQASSIVIAGTTQATATLRDVNNNVLTGRTVVWSSDNTAIATVNSGTGVVTGVAVGTANIIATSEGKTGSAAVTVGLAPVNTVTVGLQATSIFELATTQATATLRDANNNVLTGRTVVWSSDNTAIATVNSSTGVVTGVAAGTANIIATSEGKTGSALVTVTLAPVNTVTVGLQASSIFVLATTQATATLKDVNNNTLSGRTVVWTSDNTAVATVNSSTGVVTGVAAGTANIIATSEGKTGSALVTVTLAPVNTVTVGLQSSSIFIAGTTQATATLRDVNNNVLTGRTVVWSSSNTAIATVDPSTGLVTGVAAGTANIIATSEGKSGSAAVTVSVAPVNTVTVALDIGTIAVSGTAQGTATLKDVNNNVLTGRTITWSSDNTAVATVDPVTGVVTGVSAGTANIIATSEGKTGQSTITVTAQQ